MHIPSKTIVIIGGGFSGIMVTANIVSKANEAFDIFIVEKSKNLAKGIAYSTPEPYHLLNVPGGNMGAFTENPHHFIEWLTKNETLWRSKDKTYQSLPISVDHYYPRKLYGVYLEYLFKTTRSEAAQKNINITIVNDEAYDIEVTEKHTAIVKLKNNILPEAYHVVIATGNTPVKSFSYAHGIFLCNDKYVDNMWANKDESLLNKSDLSFLPESTQIAIVGTGLTMADAFLSLHNKNYKGKIIAISRHGKLPQPHEVSEKYDNFINKQNYPDSAYKLFMTIRNEVKRAIKKGYNWRSVLQAIRPITNDIWKNLPIKERRYIARTLLSYWNVHRHRIPSEVLELLNKYITSGKLKIIPGTIYYIGGKSNKPLMISYRRRGEDVIESIAADYVINCSGPETDIAKSGNQFLLKLRDRGIISVGTLRMGIELTKSGRVKGNTPYIFHAVGSVLIGEKIESTAVPDIRVQATEIADLILSDTRDEDYHHNQNYFI